MDAPYAGASQGQPRGLGMCTCGTAQDIDLITKEGKQVLSECDAQLLRVFDLVLVEPRISASYRDGSGGSAPRCANLR